MVSRRGRLVEAGSCLLFSAVIDVGATKPISIVGVILAQSDHASAANDAAAIIDGIRAGFHPVAGITAGDAVGSYATAWGEKVKIVADRSAKLLTWSDSPITGTSNAKPIGLAKARTIIGSASFAGESGKVTVPLLLKSTIKGPDGWWRITHPNELFGA